MTPKGSFEIRRASDEMSELDVLKISIPAFGATPVDEAFEEFRKLKVPDNLSTIKEEFDYELFQREEEQNRAKFPEDELLSLEAYRRRVCLRIAELEEKLLDGQNPNTLMQIVNISISLGKTVEHARLRKSQLENVKRGKKVRDGASFGGELSRGRTSEDTDKILEIMRSEIALGKTVSDAARKAKREVPGKKLGSYRKLFERHKK